VNTKQLLVVGLVVGLLLIGWMFGQQSYRFHHQVTVTSELIPSESGTSHPSSRPADYAEDAILECGGPLRTADGTIHVVSPAMATVGYDPWQFVYAEPNPCIAESAARRHTLELEAVAVLLLGVVGLVVFRTRSDTPRSPTEPTSVRPTG
jgi:hypothetical protein